MLNGYLVFHVQDLMEWGLLCFYGKYFSPASCAKLSEQVNCYYGNLD